METNFIKFESLYFAIIVKEVSLILMKLRFDITITTTDIVSLVTETIFSMFRACSKICYNSLNINIWYI